MIREIVELTEEKYLLHIPKKYLNRKIEILVLPIDPEDDEKAGREKNEIIKKTSGIIKAKNIDPITSRNHSFIRKN